MDDILTRGEVIGMFVPNKTYTGGGQMKKLDILAATLVLVGGLNWGLVAVAKFDLVAWICGGMDFGETNAASRVIYGLVGLAAVYGIGSLLNPGRTHTRRATVGDSLIDRVPPRAA
jgi:hypothetical protein